MICDRGAPATSPHVTRQRILRRRFSADGAPTEISTPCAGIIGDGKARIPTDMTDDDSLREGSCLTHWPPVLIRPNGATWRSGYAAVCKTVYTSSILVVASIPNRLKNIDKILLEFIAAVLAAADHYFRFIVSERLAFEVRGSPQLRCPRRSPAKRCRKVEPKSSGFEASCQRGLVTPIG